MVAGPKKAGVPGRRAGGPLADRGVAAAWERLARAVAEALAVLAEDQCLILSAKRRGYFVQLVSLGADGVHAEAVSNSWLRPKNALDAQQAALLGTLGWAAPNVTRAQIDAAEKADDDEERPTGSSNFFRRLGRPRAFRSDRRAGDDDAARGLRHPEAGAARVRGVCPWPAGDPAADARDRQPAPGRRGRGRRGRRPRPRGRSAAPGGCGRAARGPSSRR